MSKPRRPSLTKKVIRGLEHALHLTYFDMQADTYDAKDNPGGHFQTRHWDDHTAAAVWLEGMKEWRRKKGRKGASRAITPGSSPSTEEK